MGIIAACRRAAAACALSCALTAEALAAEVKPAGVGIAAQVPSVATHVAVPSVAAQVPVPEEESKVVDRDRQLGPALPEPHYVRAALEMLGVVAIGVGQYWLNRNTNSRDWDFPHWTERLGGSGVRFDNNTHVTNNVLHPLAGSAYYGLSRANGLSVGASALYTFASSAAWETVEWREKISINDMVTTTIGGIAAGEFFTQLGSYLNSSPGETNFAQDLAKGTLGFPIWVHDRIDGRRPDPRPTRDNLGFSSEFDHRFTLGYENRWLTNEAELRQQTRGVTLDGRIVSLPGYMEAETFNTTFAQGNFTSASLEIQFNEAGFREADMEFGAVLAGYYTQHANPGVLGALIGLATGLEFFTTETLEHGDEYALVHCAGPELGASWKSNGYQLDVRVRATADFAAIRSLAWPAVKSRSPDQTYKSSLERSYQYHVGLSTRLAAELRLHAARLFAELGLGSYRSIQGYDRFQETITRDLQGSETLDEHKVGFALEPPGTPLRFYAQLEGSSHESWLGGEMRERFERRSLIGAGLAF